MRHLRVEPHRRQAPARHGDLDRRERRRRHTQEPLRSGLLVLVQQARARRGREDGNRPGVRDGGGDRPEAHPLDDAQAQRDVEHRGPKLAPAEVRLGTHEHEEVPPTRTRAEHLEVRPGDVREGPVEDIEHGPARPVVDQRVAVEGDDRLAVTGELVRAGGGGSSGIDPPVERGDHHGGDQAVHRPGYSVEGHGASIVGRSVGPARRHPPGVSRDPRRGQLWWAASSRPRADLSA